MDEHVDRSPADERVKVRRSLSPSRMDDFLNCPLRFRYRFVDGLPEPPSSTATRGTLVHEVLDRIFDRERSERDVELALELLPDSWKAVQERDPRARGLFADAAEERLWLQSAEALLESYFALEDPSRLEPAERELNLELELGSGLRLRGILDRLDEAPDGRLRIVDYKTGKAPPERFQDRAMAQLKFYALVVWKLRGVLPTVLSLYYLGNRTVLSWEPDEYELEMMERRIDAVWQAIEQSFERKEFVPRTSPLCRFCSFRDHCPEYEGVMLPFPEVDLV